MVYLILKLTIIPLVKLWIKKINGVENIPKEKGFIIVPNHSSYMDHLIIGSIFIPYLNKKSHFLAKKEYFDKFFERVWHNYLGGIPLDRQTGSNKSLEIAIKLLKQNKIIGIYPEGTRTLTGKIQKAKTGVARLALLSKVPVLPIGLVGTFKILPKGKYMPRFRKATINIGKPMYFNQYYNKSITKKLLREITTKIMKEIAKLSGQKYNFD